MDASQYKDYVLVLLFVKYVSDRYADEPYAPITIPKGASFADMVALKGKTDIGDQINKKILDPLAQANKLSDTPDFNDPNKLGSISKQGDRYLRSLFTTGALAVIRYAKIYGTKHRPWLTALLARRPTKVAAANKIARMAWAMMTKGERYKEPIALAA